MLRRYDSLRRENHILPTSYFRTPLLWGFLVTPGIATQAVKNVRGRLPVSRRPGWGNPVLVRCCPQPRPSISQGPFHIQKILNLESRMGRGGHRCKHGIPFLCPMLRTVPPGRGLRLGSALRLPGKPGEANHRVRGVLPGGVEWGISHDWPTRCRRQEGKREREREKERASATCRRTAAAAKRQAARHVASTEASKRHPQNDWHALSLAKTRRP
jgi:hypothetical protein